MIGVRNAPFPGECNLTDRLALARREFFSPSFFIQLFKPAAMRIANRNHCNRSKALGDSELASSALGLIFNQWLFVKGLSITTAINATLLSTSIPVSTLVIGMFLGTDRTTWRRTGAYHGPTPPVVNDPLR